MHEQDFSSGGRPSDPWALVVADGPTSKDSVSCLVPAKIEVPGRYPKLSAEGTVSVEPGGRVHLKDRAHEHRQVMPLRTLSATQPV